MLTYDEMYRKLFGLAMDGDTKLYQLCDDFDSATVDYSRYPSKRAKDALVAVALDIKAAYHAIGA